MGRYSSESEGSHYSRRSKKKKKHRSRSVSPASDESRSRHKKKSKKTTKQRRQSRSRSAERSHKRRRSRSRSYSRRSRSRDRRRSRSRSVESRSRRRSRSRSRSRTPRRRRRSRSDSKSRSRRSSRSRSRDRKYHDRDSDKSRRDTKTSSTKQVKEDPCASIPGFEDMTPLQQSEVRMMFALKAAAAADEKLKEQGSLDESSRTGGASLNIEEQQLRAKAIEEIESEGFAPTVFSSSRTQKHQPAPLSSHPDNDVNHEAAMFSLGNVATVSRGVIYKDHACLMHPDFQKSYEERMQRWIKRLEEYRRKKLEGEVMT